MAQNTDQTNTPPVGDLIGGPTRSGEPDLAADSNSNLVRKEEWGSIADILKSIENTSRRSRPVPTVGVPKRMPPLTENIQTSPLMGERGQGMQQLDHLLRLMEQMCALRRQNHKLREHAQYLTAIKTLQDIRNEQLQHDCSCEVHRSSNLSDHSGSSSPMEVNLGNLESFSEPESQVGDEEMETKYRSNRSERRAGRTIARESKAGRSLKKRSKSLDPFGDEAEEEIVKERGRPGIFSKFEKMKEKLTNRRGSVKRRSGVKGYDEDGKKYDAELGVPMDGIETKSEDSGFYQNTMDDSILPVPHRFELPQRDEEEYSEPEAEVFDPRQPSLAQRTELRQTRKVSDVSTGSSSEDFNEAKKKHKKYKSSQSQPGLPPSGSSLSDHNEDSHRARRRSRFNKSSSVQDFNSSLDTDPSPSKLPDPIPMPRRHAKLEQSLSMDTEVPDVSGRLGTQSPHMGSVDSKLGQKRKHGQKTPLVDFSDPSLSSSPESRGGDQVPRSSSPPEKKRSKEAAKVVSGDGATGKPAVPSTDMMTMYENIQANLSEDFLSKLQAWDKKKQKEGTDIMKQSSVESTSSEAGAIPTNEQAAELLQGLSEEFSKKLADWDKKKKGAGVGPSPKGDRKQKGDEKKGKEKKDGEEKKGKEKKEKTKKEDKAKKAEETPPPKKAEGERLSHTTRKVMVVENEEGLVKLEGATKDFEEKYREWERMHRASTGAEGAAKQKNGEGEGDMPPPKSAYPIPAFRSMYDSNSSLATPLIVEPNLIPKPGQTKHEMASQAEFPEEGGEQALEGEPITHLERRNSLLAEKLKQKDVNLKVVQSELQVVQEQLEKMAGWKGDEKRHSTCSSIGESALEAELSEIRSQVQELEEKIQSQAEITQEKQDSEETEKDKEITETKSEEASPHPGKLEAQVQTIQEEEPPLEDKPSSPASDTTTTEELTKSLQQRENLIKFLSLEVERQRREINFLRSDGMGGAHFKRAKSFSARDRNFDSKAMSVMDIPMGKSLASHRRKDSPNSTPSLSNADSSDQRNRESLSITTESTQSLETLHISAEDIRMEDLGSQLTLDQDQRLEEMSSFPEVIQEIPTDMTEDKAPDITEEKAPDLTKDTPPDLTKDMPPPTVQDEKSILPQPDVAKEIPSAPDVTQVKPLEAQKKDNEAALSTSEKLTDVPLSTPSSEVNSKPKEDATPSETKETSLPNSKHESPAKGRDVSPPKAKGVTMSESKEASLLKGNDSSVSKPKDVVNLKSEDVDNSKRKDVPSPKSKDSEDSPPKAEPVPSTQEKGVSHSKQSDVGNLKPKDITPPKAKDVPSSEPNTTPVEKEEKVLPSKSKEEKILPSKPKEVSPSKPQDSLSSKLKEDSKSKPQDASSSKLKDVPPAKSKDELVSKTKEVTPSKVDVIPPKRKEDTTSKPSQVALQKAKNVALSKPSEPKDVSPVKPKDVPPSNPRDDYKARLRGDTTKPKEIATVKKDPGKSKELASKREVKEVKDDKKDDRRPSLKGSSEAKKDKPLHGKQHPLDAHIPSSIVAQKIHSLKEKTSSASDSDSKDDKVPTRRQRPEPRWKIKDNTADSKKTVTSIKKLEEGPDSLRRSRPRTRLNFDVTLQKTTREPEKPKDVKQTLSSMRGGLKKVEPLDRKPPVHSSTTKTTSATATVSTTSTTTTTATRSWREKQKMKDSHAVDSDHDSSVRSDTDSRRSFDAASKRRDSSDSVSSSRRSSPATRLIEKYDPKFAKNLAANKVEVSSVNDLKAKFSGGSAGSKSEDEGGPWGKKERPKVGSVKMLSQAFAVSSAVGKDSPRGATARVGGGTGQSSLRSTPSVSPASSCGSLSSSHASDRFKRMQDRRATPVKDPTTTKISAEVTKPISTSQTSLKAVPKIQEPLVPSNLGYRSSLPNLSSVRSKFEQPDKSSSGPANTGLRVRQNSGSTGRLSFTVSVTETKTTTERTSNAKPSRAHSRPPRLVAVIESPGNGKEGTETVTVRLRSPSARRSPRVAGNVNNSNKEVKESRSPELAISEGSENSTPARDRSTSASSLRVGSPADKVAEKTVTEHVQRTESKPLSSFDRQNKNNVGNEKPEDKNVLGNAERRTSKSEKIEPTVDKTAQDNIESSSKSPEPSTEKQDTPEKGEKETTQSSKGAEESTKQGKNSEQSELKDVSRTSNSKSDSITESTDKNTSKSKSSGEGRKSKGGKGKKVGGGQQKSRGKSKQHEPSTSRGSSAGGKENNGKGKSKGKRKSNKRREQETNSRNSADSERHSLGNDSSGSRSSLDNYPDLLAETPKVRDSILIDDNGNRTRKNPRQAVAASALQGAAAAIGYALPDPEFDELQGDERRSRKDKTRRGRMLSKADRLSKLDLFRRARSVDTSKASRDRSPSLERPGRSGRSSSMDRSKKRDTSPGKGKGKDGQRGGWKRILRASNDSLLDLVEDDSRSDDPLTASSPVGNTTEPTVACNPHVDLHHITEPCYIGLAGNVVGSSIFYC